MNIRTQDIIFLLDYLEHLNEADQIFHDSMNLEKIGAIGHSLGGAAIFEAAKVDDRIKACVMLDPSFHLIVQDNVVVSVPLLVIRQEASNLPEMGQTMNKTIASDCIQGQVYADKVTKGRSSFVRVKGAHHMSFSDVPLHFEDRDAARLHCLINRCVVSFLKDHLPLNGAFSFRTFLRNHSEEIQTIDREGFVIDIEK